MMNDLHCHSYQHLVNISSGPISSASRKNLRSCHSQIKPSLHHPHHPLVIASSQHHPTILCSLPIIPVSSCSEKVASSKTWFFFVFSFGPGAGRSIILLIRMVHPNAEEQACRKSIQKWTGKLIKSRSKAESQNLKN